MTLETNQAAGVIGAQLADRALQTMKAKAPRVPLEPQASTLPARFPGCLRGNRPVCALSSRPKTSRAGTLRQMDGETQLRSRLGGGLL